MNAQEVVSLINKEKSVILATVRKNVSPHISWSPVAYVDGKLYTYGDPQSIFYKNVKRDCRVSVAITSGNRPVFIEEDLYEVASVKEIMQSLLARILTEVKDWIPSNSYNYASFSECEVSIFEVSTRRIISYKGS